MVQSFGSPLQHFTLESLVALEQWSSAQARNDKKNSAKRPSMQRPPLTARQVREKDTRNEL